MTKIEGVWVIAPDGCWLVDDSRQPEMYFRKKIFLYLFNFMTNSIYLYFLPRICNQKIFVRQFAGYPFEKKTYETLYADSPAVINFLCLHI